MNLITTENCPKCKVIKEKYGHLITVLDPIDSLVLASFHNIMVAPALEIEDGKFITDYDEIVKFLENIQ